MSRPIIKFIADFGPLLIFFTIYFKNNNDLKLAIPPFIIATFIALLVVYFLEKKILKKVHIQLLQELVFGKLQKFIILLLIISLDGIKSIHQSHFQLEKNSLSYLIIKV